MCTLLIARDVFPYDPLVVAANRDEQLDRPAEGFRRWDGPAAVLAPRDRMAGGTWIGVSERGVFAGIVSRTDIPMSTRLQTTRGLLALIALEAPTAAQAVGTLVRLRGSDFNGFRLAVVDRRGGYVVSGGGPDMTVEEVESGLSVLTDRGIVPWAPDARALRAQARFNRMAREGAPTAETLRLVLADCDAADHRVGACRHRDHENYGTRSSTVIRVDEGWSKFRVWHADRKPCLGPFGEPTVMPIRR